MAEFCASAGSKQIENLCDSSVNTQNMQEVNGFKDTFDTELSKFYQTRTGAVKTPWAKEKIFEVIRHVKSAEVAINSGVRRNAAEYYWSSRYDVMNIGGSKMLCFICKNEIQIRKEREEAHQGMKRAAEKMISHTAKKLPALDIGNRIFLNVPKIDRGPMDDKNMMGKIIDMRNGVYQVGTRFDVIKNWSSRQELQISNNKYLAEIPPTTISLREAVSKESLFGGQGFHKYACKPAKNQCHTNRLSLSPYPRNFTQWQIKEWKERNLPFCVMSSLSAATVVSSTTAGLCWLYTEHGFLTFAPLALPVPSGGLDKAHKAYGLKAGALMLQGVFSPCESDTPRAPGCANCP
ncbi:hypothetical protein EVAR_83208_1 [Eumeta japonica]|uniref:Uncharacterized protein n=1 Tax=Eumeta variegata TaxID=151549 RepID=A0A4C1YS09_EUMVA|nr:hypothetical protein EVAR_83208_1 [Eumeta japonica]